MNSIKTYLPMIGRILIGAAFIFSGVGKLTSHDATVAYIASVGLPFPQLGWLIALLVEIGCGTLLLIGYRVRLIAGVFALFCLATAIFFHHNFADQNQAFHFLKNIMLIGSFMQIAYFGAGPRGLGASHTPQATS